MVGCHTPKVGHCNPHFDIWPALKKLCLEHITCTTRPQDAKHGQWIHITTVAQIELRTLLYVYDAQTRTWSSGRRHNKVDGIHHPNEQIRDSWSWTPFWSTIATGYIRISPLFPLLFPWNIVGNPRDAVLCVLRSQTIPELCDVGYRHALALPHLKSTFNMGHTTLPRCIHMYKYQVWYPRPRPRSITDMVQIRICSLKYVKI